MFVEAERNLTGVTLTALTAAPDFYHRTGASRFIVTRRSKGQADDEADDVCAADENAEDGEKDRWD